MQMMRIIMLSIPKRNEALKTNFTYHMSILNQNYSLLSLHRWQ